MTGEGLDLLPPGRIGSEQTGFVAPTLMLKDNFAAGTFGRIIFPDTLEGKARRLDVNQPLAAYQAYNDLRTPVFHKADIELVKQFGAATLAELLKLNPETLRQRNIHAAQIRDLRWGVERLLRNLDIGPEGYLIAHIIRTLPITVPLKYDAARQTAVAQALEKLDRSSKYRRKVLEYRFGFSDGIPKTAGQIGEIFNFTHSYASQVVIEACDDKHLGHPFTISDYFSPFKPLPAACLAREAFSAQIPLELDDRGLKDKTVAHLPLRPTTRRALHDAGYPDSTALGDLVTKENISLPPVIRGEVVRSLGREFKGEPAAATI